MALSLAGGPTLANGAELGGLVFVIGPLLMAVILRTFGGDGWSDAGLRLGPLRWYAFALLVFPITFGLILWLGRLTGSIVIAESMAALATAAAFQLARWLLFAAFEEWGWRGYLEPRLAAIGIPDLKRHLLTGVIWAIWHIPYIIAIADYNTLPPVLFAPLFLGAVLAMAVVYGQLRKASGTVWTAVLAHGMGNALASPLVRDGAAEFEYPALIATRPENLVFIALWAGIGWMMLRRRADASRRLQKL